MRAIIARRRVDLLLAVSLFVVAFGVASWYVPHYVSAGGRPWFYQQEFGPAVMTACGLGYVNPQTATHSALEAFLERKADEVDCSDLTGADTQPLTSMQRAFRYLMLAVGTTWRLSGHVSWSSLTPLYGIFYGLTVILAFGILRQGMGRTLAALATTALIFSTLHLNNLPHLRDYAKAPFVLAVVLLAFRLVLEEGTAWRAVTLAGLAGAVTGVGIGFRNDLLVAIPAMVGVLAVFQPGGLRATLARRGAAVAVYLVTVYAAMWPMSSIYQTGGGSSSQHLILLGLTPAFSADLGLQNNRLYEMGFEYRDELALAMINSYAVRHLGRSEFLAMYSGDYDRAASHLLLDVAKLFPADLMARVYASTIRITELPHSYSTAALVVPDFLPMTAKSLLEAKADVLRLLDGFWPWPILFALAATSIASMRLGLFAVFGVGYLSGYPALQFQERHFFHLEFIGWFALGVTLSLSGRMALTAAGRERLRRYATGSSSAGWARSAAMAAAVWLVLALGLVGPLWVLRQYQQGSVRELLGAMLAAPHEILHPVVLRTPDGSVRFETPDLLRDLPAGGGVHAVYLRADVGGAQCDALHVRITEHYQAATVPYDFSHPVDVRVPISDTPVALFFPAYFRNAGSSSREDEPFAFAGLELPAGQADCLSGFSRVTAPPAMPVLLTAQLRPDWVRVTPYHTITGIEGRQNPAEVYAFPADLPRGLVKASLAAAPEGFTLADVSKASPTFEMDGLSWTVEGAGGVGGRGPLLYLVEMKPRRMVKGSRFIAEGTIEKGGVTFGLVANDQWVMQVHVPQTGDFSVVIQVPEDGEYKVVMANNLRGMSLENRVAVARAGLVGADGTAVRDGRRER